MLHSWKSLHGLLYKMHVFIRSHYPSFFVFFVFFSVRLLSVLCGHSFLSSPPQRPMTSDFEGFLYQILSITLFSYLNSWERASISTFQCWVLNKGITGTICTTSLVWRGPAWRLNPGNKAQLVYNIIKHKEARRNITHMICFNVSCSLYNTKCDIMFYTRITSPGTSDQRNHCQNKGIIFSCVLIPKNG